MVADADRMDDESTSSAVLQSCGAARISRCEGRLSQLQKPAARGEVQNRQVERRSAGSTSRTIPGRCEAGSRAALSPVPTSRGASGAHLRVEWSSARHYTQQDDSHTEMSHEFKHYERN